MADDDRGQRAVRRALAVIVGAWLFAACSVPREETVTPPRQPSQGGRAALRPIALPDLSRAEVALRERVQTAHASLLLARESASVTDADLASLYGELGKLLIAAEYLLDAEPYLANAQTLSPADMRWPYYLAHLHRLGNDLAKAAPLFERVLRLQPDDAPTLVWLGQVYVDQGRLDEGAALFQKALAANPGSAAALFGLGRVALAQRRHGEAVSRLEAALRAEPRALAVHYPLGLAYRGLGDERQAAAHLAQWRSVEVRPSDPLMEEIGSMLQTSLDYAMRGARALDAKRWDEAAGYFRKALELSPKDATLHLNLGTALYLGAAGDPLAWFQEAVRLSPGYARAHFALGVLLTERGRDAEAIEHLAAAVRFDARLADARFSLAEALRRVGQTGASLEHYKTLVSDDPSASQARFGYAMALVRLRRYPEARAALEEGVAAHPEQVGFIHALARLLAAAPDDAVRDGRRALAIVSELRERYGGIPIAETLAMAHAEVGQFDQAAAVQRAAIAEARRAGQTEVAASLGGNLALYERRAPCRTPWRDDDPVHRPRAATVLDGR